MEHNPQNNQLGVMGLLLSMMSWTASAVNLQQTDLQILGPAAHAAAIFSGVCGGILFLVTTYEKVKKNAANKSK